MSAPHSPTARTYFIDRYIERGIPANFELKLVPTYRCNLSCQYCYAHAFRKHYPGDMSWETFVSLIGAFVSEDGRIVRVLGGEPSLWPDLPRAIAHLRERGLRSIVLTNGTMPFDELPDEIHLNIEHYYEGALAESVVSTLESCKQRRALVRFRYNVQPNEPAQKIEQILDLASAYRVPSLHLGTAWPHERTSAFGRQIVDTVRAIRGRGFGCTLGDPMPFCMFAEDELDELCDTANLSGRCMCGHIPLLNPDGVTVFPCQAVPAARLLPASQSNETSSSPVLRGMCRAFRHGVGLIARTIDEECRSCEHYLAGVCQNGCLGNRIDLIERIVDTGSVERAVPAHALPLAPSVGTILRGDWILARRSGDPESAVLCMLLGLPGETVALMPDGEVYVQNAHAPAGAALSRQSGASAVPPGVADESAVYDLREREVLLVSGDEEGARSLSGSSAFVTGLSAIVSKPDDIGAGRHEWHAELLPADAEVSLLVLSQDSPLGPGAAHVCPSVAFDLVAARGTVVEVALEDLATRRLLSRNVVLQTRSGSMRHELALAPVRAFQKRRGCTVSVRLAGAQLSSATWSD